MILPTAPARFLLLLLEDDPDVSAFLVDYLDPAMPHAVIETAETVDDALRLIAAKQREGLVYDLGLLDFKVPFAKGLQPEVDIAVCKRLNRLRVEIVHFTAYPDDPEIVRHMAEIHPRARLGNAPVTLIRKTTTKDWAEQIRKLVVPFSRQRVNEKIEEKLLSFSGPRGHDLNERDETTHRDQRSTAQALCGTQAMTQLHRDILDNWDLLENELRAKIKQRFAVVEMDREPRELSLFGPES